MALFSSSSDDTRKYKAAKREHNARFNHRDADTDSEEYLDSARKVGEAAKKTGWLRRG